MSGAFPEPAADAVDLVPAASYRVCAGFSAPEAVFGMAAVPGRAVPAIPDGNRSAILPGIAVDLDGRRYALSVKGIGARVAPYGESPVDLDEPADFGAEPRSFAGESWFGVAPYGGQGEANAATALAISALAGGPCWRGFYLCPTIAVAELPAPLVAEARGRWWYRRHAGPYLQELRLVPSSIRLFWHSTLTLGQSPDHVLDAFGVDTPEALDAFIERFIASAFAALTLYARSARRVPWGVHGLDFDNVWLDKDSVLAPDGALHFADLEGLEWRLSGQDQSFEDRVRDQLDRNLYEVLWGVDVLVRAHARRTGRRPTQAERRREVATRIDLALLDDPHARPELGREGLALAVGHPELDLSPVRIRIVDF